MGPKKVADKHMGELKCYLFEHLLDCPADEYTWPPAKTVGIQLDRYTKIQCIFDLLEKRKWRGSQGWFKIPMSEAGNTSLAGYTFVQDNILQILSVGATTVGDANTYAVQIAQKLPAVNLECPP
ncbi:hypothetical protein BDP27DRAFT_1429390 [Rhodocollybia butyracea]|uniref:Uncharacterized protein n=1 Tax=Rhodocollybia butyracea TaxID=206335 RepID=A0A9P5TZ03_9AGAR|nr:hypothetical protein BDP27DRAFT_1429390 [Rhodocollybia butyracea]